MGQEEENEEGFTTFVIFLLFFEMLSLRNRQPNMFTRKRIKDQGKWSPKKRVKMKLISTKGIIMLMIVMTQTNQMKTLLNWMILRELKGKSKKKGKEYSSNIEGKE